MLNKKFYKTICPLVVLVLGSSTFAYADIWSTPTYTEQWTMPTYTEQWTTPSTTEQWTEPPAPTNQNSTPNAVAEEAKTDHQALVYIMLQIGSKLAWAQDESVELDVAPLIVDGRTMVPIRFIGEALNAKVEWDGVNKQATVSLKDRNIVLTLEKNTALVDGKQVALDVPPTIVNGRTFVPLRFISENMGLFIKYTAETKTIEISDKDFNQNHMPTANTNQQNPDSSSTELPIEATKDPLLDFEGLYGTWYIWTPGSVTNLYDKTTGDYATHDYTHGADQGKVVINKDGTYTMTHGAWAKDKVAEGKWRLSFPKEINGEIVQGIVLLNGLTDVDWAVAPSANGKIRLLYAMRWSDGSATWVFDSELYQK